MWKKILVRPEWKGSHSFSAIFCPLALTEPVHIKEQIARDSDCIQNARNTRADSQARAFRKSYRSKILPHAATNSTIEYNLGSRVHFWPASQKKSLTVGLVFPSPLNAQKSCHRYNIHRPSIVACVHRDRKQKYYFKITGNSVEKEQN